MSRHGLVIAGGGLAAQRCCETLRARGYDEPIRVLCEERRAPYDRPPLSKEMLAGDLPAAATALRPPGWYVDHDVELELGISATRLDPGRGRVETSAGNSIRYDHFLIATGASARTLPLLDGYENVSTLRTRDDATLLKEAIGPGTRLAVVGAGFIGLEVAATACGLGAEVTLIEALPAPLANVLGPRVGAWFAELQRGHGVEVLRASCVERVRGSTRASDLVLDSGRTVQCDHVLVGVGVEPATRWLAGSGLGMGRVAVDEAGRTEAPDVYAAGDAAGSGHWEAAARGGIAVARTILGQDPIALPPASFWSDQFDVRVQYVGHAPLADGIAVDGDPQTNDFTIEYTRGGATVAALLVGRPRRLAEARRRVSAGLDSLSTIRSET